MYVQAVIEIAPHTDGKMPRKLIWEAYRASVRGLVVFALRDTEPSAVDRILDDIVQLMPLNIPGVKYVDANDENALLKAVQVSELIFAKTDRFRTLITVSKIDPSLVWPVELGFEIMRVRSRHPHHQDR